MIKEDLFPELTQVSIIDLDGNIIFSCNILNDAPFILRVQNGVPPIGIKLDLVIPLLNNLISQHKRVFFWDKTFDYPILKHWGVVFEDDVEIIAVKKSKNHLIQKPSKVSIKGCQTLGKCFFIRDNLDLNLEEDAISINF